MQSLNFFEQFYYGKIPSKELIEIANYCINFWYDELNDNIPLNLYMGLTENEYRLLSSKPNEFVEYMIDIKYGKRSRI